MSDQLVTESWMGRAQRRLEAHANKLFQAWLETKEGKAWKGKGHSPYKAGFSLPDYVHDAIASLGRGDEEMTKHLMLTHFLED